MKSKETVNYPVFFLFLLLTLLFLGTIFLLFHAETAVSGSTWTVSAQYRSAPIPLPEFSLVNVNTANAEELESLTGIGPVLAQAILADRAENGAYEKPEDLLRVRGIGEATVSKFSDEICFADEGGEKP